MYQVLYYIDLLLSGLSSLSQPQDPPQFQFPKCCFFHFQLPVIHILPISQDPFLIILPLSFV